MNDKLNAVAFGGAATIVAAVGMLILGVLGNLGLYTGAVTMMGQWHMFFSLSAVGIVTGMIEAAVISFVFAWLFVVIYNKMVQRGVDKRGKTSSPGACATKQSLSVRPDCLAE